MQQRIAAALPKFPWLVCGVDGRMAGYAYAGTHRARAAYQWSVDTSVYVDPAFHRRGIGTRLYTCLFQILAAQGYVRAYAGITLPNAGSVGLHEAMGFQSVGIYRGVGYKLGRWHDVGWWQLTLRETTDPGSVARSRRTSGPDPVWRRVSSTSGRFGTLEYTHEQPSGHPSGRQCPERPGGNAAHRCGAQDQPAPGRRRDCRARQRRSVGSDPAARSATPSWRS